jgi:hypothetical protein
MLTWIDYIRNKNMCKLTVSWQLKNFVVQYSAPNKFHFVSKVTVEKKHPAQVSSVINGNGS